jgi:hypothetical protein
MGLVERGGRGYVLTSAGAEALAGQHQEMHEGDVSRFMPRHGTIALSALKRSARDVDDAPDLNPVDLPEPLIIDRTNGKVDIIDGLHRAAGMLGWAESESIDPTQIQVPVVDVTGYDEETVEKAADSFAPGHAQAVQKIHRLAC